MNSKHILASVIGALLVGAAGTSVAKDATITFKGSVDAATCSVTGGTGTSAGVDDFVVELPPVAVAKLAKAADIAGATPITINLAGADCTNAKVAKMSFAAANPNVDATSGNLKNKAGAAFAQNVAVQLLDKAGLPINLTTGLNTPTETIAANKATLSLTAQYIATGVATVGPVETSLVYSITYN